MSDFEDQRLPPFLLNNNLYPSQLIRSATYGSYELHQRKVLATHTKGLNERIANQLKKIDPQDQRYRSTSHLHPQEKRLPTTSSGQYIKQYPDYYLGTNPQLTDKLDQLTQKVNLIEYRQKKIQSRSRYNSGVSGSPASKLSKTTMKQNVKSAGRLNNDTSRVVFKELKSVKEDLKDLREMMHTIKESKDQENFKTNKRNHPVDRSERINKLVNTVNQSSKKSQNKEQECEQRRTVYYNKNISNLSQKNITLGSGQNPDEFEFEFKPKSRGTNLPKGINPVSQVARKMSAKKFRVTRSISKKSIKSPYIDELINTRPKSQIKTYMTKSANNEIDIISAIQDNFDGEDFSKKTVILPKLPEGFNPIMNSDELLRLGKELMISFNVSSDWMEPINIRKYKNCVFFNHLKTNILWNYDGKFYVGGWSQKDQGCKEGYGVQSVPQKYLYEGDFSKGKRNGFGIMSSYNGEYYRGNWQNGYRHGKGKLEEPSKCVYDGDWVQGRKEGYGKMRFSKKECYEGTFKAGVKDGLGKEIFKNGDAYQGDYLNGKFHGSGIYRWANGSSYNGQFDEGQRHGKGTWISSSGGKSDIYQGQYKNDKKSGKGKYHWANGSIYIGQFSNDQKNGQGTIHYNDGKILQASWEGDQIAKKHYSGKPKTSHSKK